MSADSEESGSEKQKRSMLVNELAALLDALRKLYAQISVKLWHRRMEPSPPSPLAGESADITGSLNGHIERSVSEARASSEPSPSADSPMESPAGFGTRHKEKRLLPGVRLFSGLSKYFKRRGGGAGYRRLGEKMRAETTRHINEALRLARRGDVQGAKVHTELAESAMKTASRYLPEEEYRAFQQDVETRLKAIVGR